MGAVAELCESVPRQPLAVDSLVVRVAFGLGMALLLGALVAAMVSVVIRYRHAAGIEHLQLEQLVFAGSLLRSTWSACCCCKVR